MDTRKQIGRLGEDAACNYLDQAGYAIITRNWRCRSGEIDIIAECEGRLVFVEVRTRRAGGRFGTAAESVDRRKQQKVRDIAQVYLRNVHLQNAAIRFDVITVMINRIDETITECKHYEAAF
ncbi:YraN family protein [Paenibacillus luteus]|uniref:YraN family protein n=1 Tax=Paenibacillus luteus TaxID=2545753 RepID=UPI00114233C2|nr:YraN family protein [Paenibacillus luteus]